MKKKQTKRKKMVNYKLGIRTRAKKQQINDEVENDVSINRWRRDKNELQEKVEKRKVSCVKMKHAACIYGFR